MSVTQLWRLLGRTVQEWNEDKASRLAAALAYYTVFSLTPLVTITLAIVGMAFGKDAAKGAIVQQMQDLVGRQSAQAMETAIANVSQTPNPGITSLINLGILLFAASGVFAELQGALNTIWEVAPKPGKGFRLFLQQRLLAFLMVLVIGALLLASVMLNTILVAWSPLLKTVLPVGNTAWTVFQPMGVFALTTLLFALIYKYLPQAKIAWRDVWMGALLTAALFSLGKFALGRYLGHQSFDSAFGAAGSLVFVVAWVFYSAQILFFGAEFTHVYAVECGSRIRPRKYLVALSDADRVQQGIPRTEYVAQIAQQETFSQSIVVQTKLDLIPRLLNLGLSATEIAQGLDLYLHHVETALQAYFDATQPPHA